MKKYVTKRQLYIEYYTQEMQNIKIRTLLLAAFDVVETERLCLSLYKKTERRNVTLFVHHCRIIRRPPPATASGVSAVSVAQHRDVRAPSSEVSAVVHLDLPQEGHRRMCLQRPSPALPCDIDGVGWLVGCKNADCKAV